MSTSTSSPTTRVFLRGLAHALGERSHEVRTMAEVDEKPRVMEELLAQGCARYWTTSGSPAELARRSLASTLERAATSPEEIDAVVYCSFSAWSLEFCSTDVSSAMCALGLPRVPVLGLNLGACGVLGVGLRVASSLVRTGEAQRVLLVTTDRVPPDRSRVVDEFSVLSDGAGSCLVTSEQRGAELELVGLEHFSRFEVDQIDTHARRWVMYLNGVRGSFEATLARIGRRLGELDLLVHNNYIDKQRRAFARLAEVDEGRTFCELVGTHGYVHAADVLINLAAARARGRLQPGQLALALSTGRASWTSFAVVACS